MSQDSNTIPLAPDDDTLSVKEAAAQLGVSRYTLRRWLGGGTSLGGRDVVLRSLKVSGRFRIPREALAEFVQVCNLSVALPPEGAGINWKAHEAAEKVLERQLGAKRKAG